MVSIMAKKKTEKKQTQDLFGIWTDFSKRMEEQFGKLSKTQGDEFKNMYDKWTEAAGKMNENLAGKDFKPFYESWQKYNTEFMEQMKKNLDPNNKEQMKLFNLWNENSEKVMHKFTEFVSKGINEQYDLYKLWMDTFTEKMKEGTGWMPEDFPKALPTMDHWNNMMGWFKTFGTEEGTDHESLFEKHKESYDKWLAEYAKYTKEIMKNPAFASFAGKNVDTLMENIQKNKKSWDSFMKTLEMPKKKDLDDIHKSLDKLNKNITSLNKSVEEIKKSVKKKK
jgi:hypothetical protein